jgi:hypothetical protein
MSIIIKPLNALLLKDHDLIGKAVNLKRIRMYMLFVLWEDKERRVIFVSQVEKILHGMILLYLDQKIYR